MKIAEKQWQYLGILSAQVKTIAITVKSCGYGNLSKFRLDLIVCRFVGGICQLKFGSQIFRSRFHYPQS